MTKLSVAAFDAFLLGDKEALNQTEPPQGTGQQANPMQTGENSSKEPALRKPIDAVVSAGGAVAGGIAAGVAGLAKMKTRLPMTQLD